MERLPQNERRKDLEQLKESVKQIMVMYIEAASCHLEENDPLKDRIISFYSARPETEQELLNVLGNKSEEEITAYLKAVEDLTSNPSKFIEQMEKLYELQDVHQRRREIASQDRVATDEEYELGAYVDVLESQVKEAVLAAQEKGYLTFQSGFSEKTERDQFIDFYNRNVTIPENILKYLKHRSIEVKIENLDDRTTLTLHPVGSSPIRLGEWKEIWTALIEGLPLADSETVPNMKLYGEHVAFRKKHDSIRK